MLRKGSKLVPTPPSPPRSTTSLAMLKRLGLLAFVILAAVLWLRLREPPESPSASAAQARPDADRAPEPGQVPVLVADAPEQDAKPEPADRAELSLEPRPAPTASVRASTGVALACSGDM